MLPILKTALRAIRRNVLRSFLTMLGLIVGIAAVEGAGQGRAFAEESRSGML